MQRAAKASDEGSGEAYHHPCTDVGNARRLVDRHGTDLRYCHGLGLWLIWNGQMWVRDDTGHLWRMAKDTVLAIAGEAAREPYPIDRELLLKHGVKSQSSARLEAMVRLARSEPEFAVRIDDLDRAPFLLNVQNGTVDLRTGELRPHAREDLITRVALVGYDPDAVCPTWDTFLNQIMAGDAALVDYITRVLGYTLTGSTEEEIFLMFHGVGANGKTTLLETIGALLGDYATPSDFSTFLSRRPGSIRNDIARLQGVRMVWASESGEGRQLDEGLMKQLTGSDTIVARFLYREHVAFRPAFKLFVATNHPPRIRGTDPAIWRRTRVIPFTVTIPEEDRDRGLKARLLEEGPGILAQAVRGCLAWQREGLCTPASVLDATDQYRQEMDTVGQFIDDRCELSDSAFAPSADLYSAFVEWCRSVGEPPMTANAFGRKLTERNLQRGRRQGRGWFGIRLLSH
jgi:putative DNA primase/helicase